MPRGATRRQRALAQPCIAVSLVDVFRGWWRWPQWRYPGLFCSFTSPHRHGAPSHTPVCTADSRVVCPPSSCCSNMPPPLIKGRLAVGGDLTVIRCQRCTWRIQRSKPFPSSDVLAVSHPMTRTTARCEAIEARRQVLEYFWLSFSSAEKDRCGLVGPPLSPFASSPYLTQQTSRPGQYGGRGESLAGRAEAKRTVLGSDAVSRSPLLFVFLLCP